LNKEKNKERNKRKRRKQIVVKPKRITSKADHILKKQKQNKTKKKSYEALDPRLQ